MVKKREKEKTYTHTHTHICIVLLTYKLQESIPISKVCALCGNVVINFRDVNVFFFFHGS